MELNINLSVLDKGDYYVSDIKTERKIPAEAQI